uniref:Uncharacterized protein n=1 Tax=Globodera rostochiensis TaxID=31243 RepID=A0A914GX75_GLORO
MSLVVVKVNDHHCRAVIATNFTNSFCGAGLVKSLKLTVTDLNDSPTVTSSDGTPVEFLGQALVQMELGPWHSNGFMPMLIAFDCPADVLIGQDLINEISNTFPIKFEYYKNSVNIGGTRVSMLDPMASEEKFLSVRVLDPRSNEELGLETWKKGVREGVEMGGLVKRRVEVLKTAKEERGDDDEMFKTDEAEEEPENEINAQDYEGEEKGRNRILRED